MSGPLRVLLAGGDGYCPFYGTELKLRETTKQWFDGQLPNSDDSAILFEVEDGEFAGTLIALTSRWTTPLRTQLDGGGAAVVVHHISNPNEWIERGGRDSCGMSYVLVLPAEKSS